MDGVVTDFLEIWTAMRHAIRNQSIRVTAGEGAPYTLQVRDDFFNEQPELRNRKRDRPKFPGLVLTLMTPKRDSTINIQEWTTTEVNVDAAVPYLEATGTTFNLSNGQTMLLSIGRPTSQNTEQITDYTIVFNSASFANINAATPLELAATIQLQLIGVAHVTVEGTALNRVRISGLDASSRGSMEITGGTAVNFINAFPRTGSPPSFYKVSGRDAGPQTRYTLPPVYYNCQFSITQKSTRLDHHALLTRLIARLFLNPAVKSNKLLVLANKPFEVMEMDPVDAHVPTEGIFVTTHPFVLKRVPFSLGDFFFQSETGQDVDTFNGGNYGGSGSPTLPQFPAGPLELEFGVDEVGTTEDLG